VRTRRSAIAATPARVTAGEVGEQLRVMAGVVTDEHPAGERTAIPETPNTEAEPSSHHDVAA